MAAKSNGWATDGQKGLNGHAANGKPSAPRSKASFQTKSTPRGKAGSSIFNIISRLFTWYSIVTILFRCPASIDLLTDSSPKICKPYFQVRSVLTPHLEPYYNAYAAPYVDAARPYYNIVDRNIVAPAAVIGKKYGAPRLAQAQAYGQHQWEKNLQPQVQIYQDVATKKYEQTLAPHFNKAADTVGPYIGIAKTNALQTYYGHILPTYTTVQPYALQGYDLASNFVLRTAIPSSIWVYNTSRTFLDRTVFPKLRILYGENVEPQLVRIGERLGRYRDGKKLMSVVNEVDITSSLSSASSTFSSLSSSVASAHATPPPAMTTPTPGTAQQVISNGPTTEKSTREKAQDIVQKDLKTWQEKFAKAADEGSDELDERITEISDRLIQSQARKVGRALNIQLEETVRSSLSNLKKTIISIVKSSNDEEEKEDSLNTAVRKAGVAIKEKAQAVRTWRQSYDRETNTLVGKAAEDTFEILDHIRDLGLQEIGMRWAWTDGVTHKDWTKYHNLKTRFDQWRGDVGLVVTEHPGLASARVASEEVESTAMNTAEEAAKELARMKETGRWKISTGDTSDDWTTKIMPAAAANAGQKIVKKISEASEAVVGTSQGTVESIASVASSSVADVISSAHSAASSISTSIIGSPQGSVESIISVGSSGVNSVVDQASSSIIGTQQGSIESLASVASISASSIAKQVSSSVIGTSQGTIESVASVASASASSVAAEVSSSVIGSKAGTLENVSSSIKSAASAISKSIPSVYDAASSSISSVSSSVASSLSDSVADVTSSASSAASSASKTASKKVRGGAQAQFVEARQIIFEDVSQDSDDDTFSEKIQSMASAAGDRFADVTNAVSDALKPTATAGTVETVSILAAEKLSRALSAASVALYGTDQGAGESIGSVVSSRYTDAIAAASSVIYGTPTPFSASLAAQASQAYSDALSQAAIQYEAARSIVSKQISGTPKPVQQEMYTSVESAYSAATLAANSRFQAALSAASIAVIGTTKPLHESLYSAMMPKSTGAFESMSAVASSRLAEGLSAASAHFEDAKSYLGAVQTGDAAKQKISAQIQNQYYAGIGMAHARYSEFLSAASSLIPAATSTPAYQAALSGASSQASKAYDNAASSVSSVVYGSETPWAESVASAASSNWEALITKASEQVYGQPTPYFMTERFLAGAKEYAGSATDGVASQYTAVASLISELVSGKEPDFTESVYARFSSAYYTGAGAAISSASSYASDTYASASSVVVSVFTPPAAIEAILDTAALKVNEAVEAASIQFYGTTKGTYEQATESASSFYASASSVAAAKIYGSQTGYAEAAQSSMSAAVASAQQAISEAIYGTPTATGFLESATSAAAETYSSTISAASAQISSALYGPEQGAVESAQSRLGAAVESAKSKLAEFAAAAGAGASDTVSQASAGIEDFASSVSSAITGGASHVKDEL